ncbi:hypothetical protein FKM82_023628 [Ascaphus truei]
MRTRAQLKDKCREYGLPYENQEVADMVDAIGDYDARLAEPQDTAQLALIQPPGDQGRNPVPGRRNLGEGTRAPPRSSGTGGVLVAAATSQFTPEMLALITAPAYCPPVQPNNDELKLDQHSLTKFVEGTDQIDSFLKNFETQCRRYKVLLQHRVAHLDPLLSGLAKQTMMALPDEYADDYEHLKELLLFQYGFTPEAYQGKFPQEERQTQESYVTYVTRMALYGIRWVEGYEAQTYQRLLDLIFHEQLMQQCPPAVRAWVYDKKPKTYQEAARLADDYVASRALMPAKAVAKAAVAAAPAKKSANTPHWTQRPPAGSSPPKAGELRHERRCYNCNRPGHIRPDCPEPLRTGGPHQGQRTPAAKPVARVRVASTTDSGPVIEPTPSETSHATTVPVSSEPTARRGGHLSADLQQTNGRSRHLTPVSVGDRQAVGLMDSGAAVTLV